MPRGQRVHDAQPIDRLVDHLHGSQAGVARGREDDGAAIGQHAPGRGQQLARLVQARRHGRGVGHQHHRRPRADGHLEDRARPVDGGPVRADRIPRLHRHQPPVRASHPADREGWPGHRRGGLHVGTARVAQDDTQSGPRGRLERVVVPDARFSGDAGEEQLGAARVAGEVVGPDLAHEHAQVGVEHRRRVAHVRAARREADRHQIGRPRVVDPGPRRARIGRVLARRDAHRPAHARGGQARQEHGQHRVCDALARGVGDQHADVPVSGQQRVEGGAGRPAPPARPSPPAPRRRRAGAGAR